MIFAIYVQILKSKLQAKAGTSLWFVGFYTDIKEHLLAGFDKDLQKSDGYTPPLPSVKHTISLDIDVKWLNLHMVLVAFKNGPACICYKPIFHIFD